MVIERPQFIRPYKPRDKPVLIWISKQGTPATSPIKGLAKLTPSQAQQIMAGDWCMNVHTADHPAAEIRGQVVPPKPLFADWMLSSMLRRKAFWRQADARILPLSSSVSRCSHIGTP
jgi:CHRD domain